MNFKQLLSAAALATLSLVPSQTNAQQARPKGMPHLLKPHNSTLMLKAQKVPLGRELWGNVVKSTRWTTARPSMASIHSVRQAQSTSTSCSSATICTPMQVVRWWATAST